MPSEIFDFAFPVGAYGNSSAWWPPRGVNLHRQPDLAARRLLSLIPTGEAVFMPARGNSGAIRTSTFFEKRPYDADTLEQGLLALSSGAGSALVRDRDKQTFKLKRCGLADQGFPMQYSQSHRSVNRDGEQFEFSDLALAGLMNVETAAVECEMANELHSIGLTPAYKPCGIFLINRLSAEHNSAGVAAAVLMKVRSDLRVDELVYMTMTPLLADLFDCGKLSYDDQCEHWGFFGAEALPTQESRRRWKDISEKLSAIGESVGSAYRRLHEAGYLRGIGSCWFGNEVVDEDGEISIVDFDGGATKDSTYAADVARDLKCLEFEQYCSESLLMLTPMRPRALMLFGMDFINAVRRGYREQYTPLPRYLLNAVISEHLDKHQAVWEALGFAGDPSTPIRLPASVSESTFLREFSFLDFA